MDSNINNTDPTNNVQPQAVVPATDLMKWCGLSCLEREYLINIKLAYLFYDVAVLVNTRDEVFMVGRNVDGGVGGSTKVPQKVEALSGKGVCDVVAFREETSSSSLTSPSPMCLFALTDDGSIYGWGSNKEGLLGLGLLRSKNKQSSTSTLTFAPTSTLDQPPLPPSSLLIPPTKLPFPGDVKLVAMSVGGGHTLAVSKDGKLWAWGKNDYGQLGNNLPQSQPQQGPILVPLSITCDARRQIKVSMVAAGSYHSVALTDDGSVYTWGKNDKGQLGNGSKAAPFMPTPKRINFPTRARMTKIACGKNHSLALSEKGEVFSWGTNHHGELGNGSTHSSSKPRLVLFGEEEQEIISQVVDIAALPYASISVCQTPDVVYMWGKLPEVNGKAVDLPWNTLLPSMSDVFSSFCDPPIMHKSLLPPPPGQITTEPDDIRSYTTAKVLKWSGLKFVDHKILNTLRLAFVCGSGFEQTGILVTVEDDVLFVGRNVHGSFGTGDSRQFETNSPSRNITLSGTGICSFHFGLDVEGGCMCLFALTKSGSVYSWGYNDFGELGQGVKTLEPGLPVKIGATLEHENIITLAAGSDHILAISDEGRLFSWGYNFWGQLGTGNLDDHVPFPEQITDFRRPATIIVDAAAGMFHSVAVTSDGHVYAFGCNEKGQLGGSTTDAYSATPVLVKKLPTSITKVTCGPDCSLVISTEGKLFIFGHCKFLETNKEYFEPVAINMDLGPDELIVDVGAAHWSSVYGCQTSKGRVFVWGKVRGASSLSTPVEETRATSVDDLFAMFSTPPGMITTLTL